VLFYCHFPDLLLAQRRSRAHSAYRAPLDYAEQATTGMADRLLVNSHYTQGFYKLMLPCVWFDACYHAVHCCMLAVAIRRLRYTLKMAENPVGPCARGISHVLLSSLPKL